ncbi:TonB-dependent receptor [Snuella lapsa]|uniref:TonB-dependent receptor n=1 Tax=Snuella lapsa TaxID=870481 RepID=A0ABP6Y311_9FLAO
MKQIKFLLILFLTPVVLLAQQTVKGTVTDDQNLPLPGASIIIKGTTKGAVTDFDGTFTIDVDATPAVLKVSFLGFVTQEITITNQTTVNIVLESDQETLDEVVVIGYGSVNKKDLTGAVTSIKPTAEVAEQSNGIENLIRGRAAGVQVSANGSEPGASVSIKIRGTSSLTGNSEPLYVVDGIIMDTATEDTDNPISGYASQQGGISGVNPQDIESVEVLKDASATAIYGSRAANGVIIITTKKGKTGKAKFNFTSSVSTGSVVRDIDVLDTESYANYQNDVRETLGQEPRYTINPNGTIFTTGDTPTQIEGIHWGEDTYRNPITKRNRLSISGGGDKGNYYISGGMLSNQGSFPNALAKSIDFNLNVNQDLTDRITLTTKIATTYTELNSSKGTDENGSTNTSMVRQVLLAAPILNFSDNNLDNGDVEDLLDGPRAWASDYDDDATEIRLLGSLNLDYKISKSLTYRFRFGGDYRKKERSFWYGTALFKGAAPNGIAGIGTLNRFRYNIDNTLMYRKTFNKNHKVNATVGYLIDKTSIQKTRYSASDFADKSLRADGISFAGVNTPLILDSEYPTILSYIGRLNYTLFNRYLFTGTFRADGSSKFAEGNRWGYFPAFSFAWQAINEPFLRNQKTISNLKLRLGYGEVGNQNIPSYSFLTPFGRTEEALADADGNGSLIAVVPQNLANPDLVWESAVQYNAGLDFGFFNERLTGTVDTYLKTSSDLLLRVPVGPTSGFSFITANQGDIENRGVEVSLSGDIIRNANTKWNIFGNISLNKSKVVTIGTPPQSYGALGDVVAFVGNNVSGGTHFKQPANIFIEGEEIGLFYGLETRGIIRSDADLTNTPNGEPLKYGGTDLRVGDVYFVDQNGDGDITDADKTIIGNPNPDFTYAFGSSFEYKNLSLSFLFNGVYGNNIANANLFELGYANHLTKNVQAIAYTDVFDPVTNPNGNYPYVGVGGLGVNYTTDFNDRMVEDGSFLRLSYVTLGYNIPVKDISFIDSMKLTVSGQNLWLLTDYSGFDPEVNSFAYDPLRVGIDSGSFPNQRTFTVGLNVTF